MIDLSLLVAFVGIATGVAASLPTSQSLGGDVQLLYQNDLNSNTATQHRSALLLSSQSITKAFAACGALSETLLPHNSTFFKGDLSRSLQYLVFTGQFKDSQEFWIASEADNCFTVNAMGSIASSSCARVLPALCSQSSPFAIPPATISDPKFAIDVQSQGLTITGYRDQLSFRFLGIPYANKPERFTYSELYSGASEINATTYGPPCLQSGSPTSSEDCLSLNVFTPVIPSSRSTQKLKPVVFWIHGGAFTGGSNSDPSVDGGNLVSRGDVVYVNVQYRLSTLGFLALDDGITNGNFGLADQIVALDWVRTHIAAFGGDPDHITIWGQSAGAASVRALMASPQAIGKFVAAVPMSNLAGANYATTYSQYYTIPEEISAAADPILQLTGCDAAGVDPLTCLRAYDAMDLVSLPTVARFLVVDGKFLTSSGLPLNGSGPIANVHTLMGTTRDDGAALVSYPANSNLTQGLIGSSLPTSIAQQPNLFPLPGGPDPVLDVFNVTARATSDNAFRCLDQATAISATQHDLVKSVWFYEFNRTYQPPGYSPNPPHCQAPVDADHPNGNPEGEYFKCHSGEIFFTFGTLTGTSALPFRDSLDLPFMQLIVDQWTSFFRTFDPNPDFGYLSVRGYTSTAAAIKEAGLWQQVTKENINGKPLRVLQWPGFQDTFGEKSQCDFLNVPFTYYG